MLDKVLEYFNKHKEQAFLLKVFILAFSVYITKDFIYDFVFGLGIIFLVISPGIVFMLVWAYSIYKRESFFAIVKRNFTFLPYSYTEGEWKIDYIPWATYLLIIINLIVHFHIYEYSSEDSTEFILDNFVFFPHTPNYLNVFISPISSMFMHANYDHLLGNMFFLWAFGTVVEKHVGPVKFLRLYIITGLFADLTYAFVKLQGGDIPHSLGASGAISGIMGIYAVRCYFKTIVMPIPVLGILSIVFPLNLKIRLNALSLVLLYFISDLAKGTGYVETNSNIAYWAHLGGTFFGFIIAMKMGLNRDALEDKLTEVGVTSLEKREGTGDGEESLREALEMNSENVEALLALARMKSQRSGTKFLITEEAAELYEKAIKGLVVSNPLKATEAYLEYNGKYIKGLVDPNLEFRVAGLLHRYGNLDRSGRAFEMLAESPKTPLDIKEKSLFRAAGVMEEMGLNEPANLYYKRFLVEFPDSELADKVKGKLSN